ARLIRGQAGSEVALTVHRPGTGPLPPFTISRTQIVRNPVKGLRPNNQGGWEYMLPPTPGAPAIGYVRVTEFVENQQGSTFGLFLHAMNEMMNRGATALVLDLRGNPGGTFTQAFKMVEQFVAEGVIVEERSAHGQQVHRASSPGAVVQWPIVVLVNGQTASASEIVAGSLAVNGRAVLVGERTFGKGRMQEMLPIPMGDGRQALLKLTVAYLYLPNGYAFDRTEPPADFRKPAATPTFPPRASNKPHRGGIKPTVAVELSPSESQLLYRCRRELEWPTPQAHPAPTTRPEATSHSALPRTTTPDEWADQLVKADRQLAKAVEILSNPAVYQALVAKAPTTAPEQTDGP
ncbi:MAG: S41 family peptidase, partial [Phycisphaerae bacterium]|nr:S41 family peptidase [Phycisphaerae bacterium]